MGSARYSPPLHRGKHPSFTITLTSTEPTSCLLRLPYKAPGSHWQLIWGSKRGNPISNPSVSKVLSNLCHDDLWFWDFVDIQGNHNQQKQKSSWWKKVKYKSKELGWKSFPKFTEMGGEEYKYVAAFSKVSLLSNQACFLHSNPMLAQKTLILSVFFFRTLTQNFLTF